MKQHRLDWIACGTVFVLFVGFLLYARHQYSIKTPSNDTIEDHIVHADSYYWFSHAGHGSSASLAGGLKQIGLAREKFQKGPAVELQELQSERTALEQQTPRDDARIASVDERIAEIHDLEARIDGSETDLIYSREMASDTFHGHFAWSHFMAKPSIFHDWRAMGSFELLDQPQVVAVRNGVRDLIDEVLGSIMVVGQHDVVFVTDPDDFPEEADLGRDDFRLSTQLENEALYLFNLNPRFFVHNMLEVAAALTPEEQLKLKKLEPTAEMLESMRDTWGHNDILVVRLKKMDDFNKMHFYSAQGRLFRGTDTTPAVIYNNYGLCRDRRAMLMPIIFFNFLMLVSAILLFRQLVRFTAHDGEAPDWKTTFGLGGMAFLWGRCAVWGLAEVVEELVPADEVLWYLSFWWTILTGVVMLLGPALVMRFAEERFGFLDKWFGMFNRRGAIFATVTMGSAAYVGQSCFWVRNYGGWPLVPPLIIASVCAAWLIGRALDESDALKMKWAHAAGFLALFIGPAFSHSYPSSLHHIKLWAVALPMAILTGAAVKYGSKIVDDEEDEKEDDGEVVSAESQTALVRSIQHPPFHTTPSFELVMKQLDDWLSGRVVRIQLIGPAGIGKTALLYAITKAAKAERPVSVMMGVCPEPHDGATPESYRPFADAIADHFSVNLLLPPENQMAGIDKAVDGIFEEMVPFSDLLFPPSEGQGASGSKQELFHSIASMLRSLTHRRPALLILDDAHWADEGSLELLEHLLKAFPVGAEIPLAIIVASRDPIPSVPEEETFELERLDKEDILELLSTGLRFEPKAARELAEAIGDQEGNLHWLFQMLSYLAGKDLIKWKQEGFGWDKSTKLSEHIPDDLLDSLRESLAAHPEFRPVLACAACIGVDFSVEVLSKALEKPRLDCIHLLDKIEAETGLVKDMQSDDMYAFRSSFILETLRRILDVNAHGPALPSPQRIREYHSQLAGAWNATLEFSSAALFKLATHRFASGTRHAEKALRDALVAARASSAQFQHAQARRYIEMAREAARAAGLLDDDLESDLLLIECHEAHVEGTSRVEVAEKILDWISDRPDSDISMYVAAALASYDAGIDTRDQTHFANAVAVGREIVERFEDPVDKAEGHHFIGIGLSVQEREERRTHMEAAMACVEEGGSNLEALRLKSRVANSLGEQLSYGDDDDRAKAKEFFLTSVELKSRPAIRDVEGLAFAHGGLGRLAFFAPEPDYDVARHHFQEDMKYSERIGSRTGQTKMHSLLAACDIKQNEDYGAALPRYESALQMAEERVDRLFAFAGLLECCGKLGRNEDITQHGPALVELAKVCLSSLPGDLRAETPSAAIPRMCAGPLKASLEICEVAKDADWHRWMDALLNDDKVLD